MESGTKEDDDEVGGGSGYNDRSVNRVKLISKLEALLSGSRTPTSPRSHLRLDGSTLDVVVMNSATVNDLRLAIKKKVNDMEAVYLHGPSSNFMVP
ncbi:hypothetical protein SAY86_004353 [Trapa natans]|uniref:SNRNP25 ubiquitin-like domain-containing protein n=1 Tax=Trapa natans TaxID=22666 RepID=A0AAN7MIE5_TRANT|nr:hypothetical protein SAY86_004353 [Trapa natans]